MLISLQTTMSTFQQALDSIQHTLTAAEPERVEQEAVQVEADEAAEFQGETSGSGDDMSVTTATLKRARDETGETDKTSSTTSEEPPADSSREVVHAETGTENPN
ncbi:hypothetical protein HPB52_020121 [Rhipicephalus sanguineus]|uniref:Uncharacterized protein n=1 Tax=Rhipicephalus sanguineus TaxID=34632 RepID=A0A9D4TBJ7_RHISA|nr:hypothetical protein HPB52_020121 [Rhipicephalus sanguineus]